jgi:hypothetical protein
LIVVSLTLGIRATDADAARIRAKSPMVEQCKELQIITGAKTMAKITIRLGR